METAWTMDESKKQRIWEAIIHNRFSMRTKARRLLYKRLNRLMNVMIEVTNDCNMDCWFCQHKERPIGYMSMSLYRSIISQLPSYVRVALNYGGESILHPQFREMVKIANAKGLRHVHVISNGLVSYDIEGLEVEIRPKPPQFITKDFDFVKLPPWKPQYDDCIALHNEMVILWNGDVTICCHDMAGKKVVGSIVDDTSLQEIWHNPQYEMLREKGFCDDCKIYPYCG